MARVGLLFAYRGCDIGTLDLLRMARRLAITYTSSSSMVRSLCLHHLHLVESYCIPNFDSPSVFARILDKDKVGISLRSSAALSSHPYQGGHFSITPTVPFVTKQNYLPNSNVLQTKYDFCLGKALVRY